jgi:HEAT repeat protein
VGCVGSTGQYRPTAVSRLVALLADSNPDVRSWAAWALEGTTDSAAVAALLEHLDDPDSNIGDMAARALRVTADPVTISRLLALARHSDSRIRNWAATALEGITVTDPSVITGLVDLLDDPDPDVRRWAAGSLQGTTDSIAVARLVERLTDADPGVRRQAAEVLSGGAISARTAASKLLAESTGSDATSNPETYDTLRRLVPAAYRTLSDEDKANWLSQLALITERMQSWPVATGGDLKPASGTA